MEQQSNSDFVLDFNNSQEIENSDSDNKITTEEQQSNTNNNVNNIYLYLFNKYKRENRNNFNEYIKAVSKMKNDADWDKLNWEQQQRLVSEI